MEWVDFIEIIHDSQDAKTPIDEATVLHTTHEVHESFAGSVRARGDRLLAAIPPAIF